MADEEKTSVEEQGEQSNSAEKKSGGMMKYLMIGGGALIVVVAVSFGTLKLLGDDPAPETEPDEVEEVAEAQTDLMDDLYDDSLFAEDDATILEKIQANLDFLDYEPTTSEIGSEETGMSVEDSLENVNWLETEKSRLAEHEKALNDRQKKLEKLDQEVSKKIVRIEQAESARIQSLAKLYDGMETRSVAKLMANLDNATIVSILPRMKIKNASAVLSLLPSKRAAILSKKMITIAEN